MLENLLQRGVTPEDTPIRQNDLPDLLSLFAEMCDKM